MRIATACKQCRNGKRRCLKDVNSSTTTCLPCRKRRLPCSNANGSTAQILRELAPARTSSCEPFEAVEVLTHEQICQFTELYLRFVHDRPHSLFHIRTLWNDINTGSIDQALLLAICAIGCRFSTDLRHRELYRTLGSRASVLLAQQLEDLSLSNVQTCILLANFYAAKRNNELEALYFGIANRTAYILRLHETNIGDGPLVRETKCRVWCSLLMADRWCPPALGLPREIVSAERMRELSMDEIAFQALDISAEIDRFTRIDGLWKHKITLVELLGPIQDLNWSLLSLDHDSILDNQQVESLEASLDYWLETLPLDRRMNDKNFENHRERGQGGTFVALHLGLHHYYTLLYFQYLDTVPTGTSSCLNFAEKCRMHALQFSQLLNKARSTNDCHVVYLTIAHMTMVSSSVLLHMLLFGDEAAMSTARVHLVYNFEALVELGKYWPQVDHVIERLLIFQKACSRSRATHRIDRWMVRFLLEHALPFPEKSSNGDEDPIETAETSPQSLPSDHNERFNARTDILSDIFTQWYDTEI